MLTEDMAGKSGSSLSGGGHRGGMKVLSCHARFLCNVSSELLASEVLGLLFVSLSIERPYVAVRRHTQSMANIPIPDNDFPGFCCPV